MDVGIDTHTNVCVMFVRIKFKNMEVNFDTYIFLSWAVEDTTIYISHLACLYIILEVNFATE